MSGAPEVAVVNESPGRYRVEVKDAGMTTSHAVNVPKGMAADLRWSTETEIELVRESFAFLLQREPPTSILQTFSLDVIGQYFPEYPAEMRKRAPKER